MAKKKKQPEYWTGYITKMDDHVIYAILKKDYNLDKELKLGKGLLSIEQNELVVVGRVIKYDVITNEGIQFLTEESKWI